MPHCYELKGLAAALAVLSCQCPLGLMPHCYLTLLAFWNVANQVSMPSRAYASLLRLHRVRITAQLIECQCPLGLMPHCYIRNIRTSTSIRCVSMPSRAYASLLRRKEFVWRSLLEKLCQCPLGLMPHCYHKQQWRKSRLCQRCQCPLGLMPHCYRLLIREYYQKGRKGVNALSGLCLIVTAYGQRQWRLKWNWCQCPLGLMPHCYHDTDVW